MLFIFLRVMHAFACEVVIYYLSRRTLTTGSLSNDRRDDVLPYVRFQPTSVALDTKEISSR